LNLFIPCPEDLFSPFFSFFFCFHFLDDTGRDPRLSIPRIKLMTGYSFIFLSFSSLPSIRMDGRAAPGHEFNDVRHAGP
jgi:hypothetical protein